MRIINWERDKIINTLLSAKMKRLPLMALPRQCIYFRVERLCLMLLLSLPVIDIARPFFSTAIVAATLAEIDNSLCRRTTKFFCIPFEKFPSRALCVSRVEKSFVRSREEASSRR